MKHPFLLVVNARYFYSIPPNKIMSRCLRSDTPNVLSGVRNSRAQELGGMVFPRLNKWKQMREMTFFQSKSLLSYNQATIETSTLRNWCSFMLIQDDFLTLLLKVGLIWSQDRKRSQMIAEDRTWFYLLRWRSQDRRRSQKCVSIWSQNFLRSAIRDRLRSYGNQP